MAEVDTSIYKVDRPDPMAKVKSLFDALGSGVDYQKNRFGFAGNVGLSKAIQDATDPQTGQVNTTKLGQILKQPENLPAATAGAGASADLLTKNIANQTAGLEQSNLAFSSIGNAWGARLSKTNGAIDPNDLRSDVIDLMSEGRVSPEVAKAVLRAIPEDPKKARDFAAGGFLQALGPAAQAAAAPATPGPGGAPRQQTSGQFVTQSLGGGGDPNAPPPAPGEPPAAPGISTGVGPSAEAALAKRGTDAAGQASTLLALGSQVPTRKAMLMNMRDYATQFTGGPASDAVNNFVKSVNELFGTNFDTQGIASKEEFDKLANQIALAQAGELGSTDARVETAMGANPHSGLSNLGIDGVLATLMGNEDAIMSKATAFQHYLDQHPNQTYDAYPGWSLQFNRQYDPRVFQATYLSPENKAQMLKGMSKSDQAMFRERYNYAVDQGWIPDPRKQGQ